MSKKCLTRPFSGMRGSCSGLGGGGSAGTEIGIIWGSNDFEGLRQEKLVPHHRGTEGQERIAEHKSRESSQMHKTQKTQKKKKNTKTITTKKAFPGTGNHTNPNKKNEK